MRAKKQLLIIMPNGSVNFVKKSHKKNTNALHIPAGIF